MRWRASKFYADPSHGDTFTRHVLYTQATLLAVAESHRSYGGHAHRAAAAAATAAAAAAA